MNNEPIKLEFEYEPRPPKLQGHFWLKRDSKYKPTVDALISTSSGDPDKSSVTVTPGADWHKVSGTLRNHLKKEGYRLVTQRRLDGKISAWTEPIATNGDKSNG